jgi:hypothetical protein
MTKPVRKETSQTGKLTGTGATEVLILYERGAVKPLQTREKSVCPGRGFCIRLMEKRSASGSFFLRIENHG